MDAERKLKQARATLMLDHPFFGYLAISGLEPVEKKDLNPPTMGTDGRHLYYHPDFVDKQSIPVLMGVIAHEVWHVAGKHLSRMQWRDLRRCNIAADYATNWILVQPVPVTRGGKTFYEPEFVLPEGALMPPPEWQNKSMEYIYAEMPVKEEDCEGCKVKGGEGKGGGGDNSGGTLDDHSPWKDFGKPNGDKGNPADELDGDADSLEKEWEHRVAQAATLARQKGKLPGHIETLVGKILEPVLDWKTILGDLITSQARSNYTMFPANKKHLWRGIYLPGLIGSTINIAFCIDSSGSISDADIVDAISELQGICETYEDFTIHVIIGDTKVNQTFEIGPFDPVPGIVQGRGGTDFRELLAEAERCENITSIVYFTDLYGTFPDREPSVPVIWLAISDAEVPWGQKIRHPGRAQRRRR